MFLLIFIFSIIFFIYKIESGKIQPNFDEIFGNEWDKNKREEVVIKIEQSEQNENLEIYSFSSTNGEEMGNDPIDQMANWDDQNIHKSDQSDNNKETDEQKREIVKKFEVIKEKLREKGKFEWKNQSKIERKIAKLLGANRKLIHKWKNELNLNKSKIKKRFYEEKKRKFIERFDEFKELYRHGKQKEFLKELGIHKETFRKWKKELLPKYNKNEHKLRKMKQYYEINESNPKMSDEIIAKKLGIGINTIKRWKKKFTSI